ncbi:DNA-binding protein [Vibrio sp. vnigr-6D03]|uniref:Ribbon-helix-helix domain-containing protein n=1 Tax=Vibrio penaeicida TaxID=104609 RepID=A0AAV5NUS5_9VIBR|nr:MULTISPECIES: ribbon-helix-helix domain-containing protein [Vibrio]MDP2575598.1 ribbon-helix-helix domain-containing protein [Vibrio penaeicida]PKF80683.1 DNA-binding protein [Vibrio sp. vnigr-6D03]RTZ21218.1 DNA-binding protein [Vibrio penaeicida]GLQ74029.1 hypothetical protein GCM10007932_33890 [Vibrio penaeicida]
MCYIFAGQSPENYQFVSRSVRLGGHSTSVRLESKFWTVIDEIATVQHMTTGQFLSLLYDEATDLHGDISNFASLLRCSCVMYLSQPEKVLKTAKQQLHAQAH